MKRIEKIVIFIYVFFFLSLLWPYKGVDKLFFLSGLFLAGTYLLGSYSFFKEYLEDKPKYLPILSGIAYSSAIASIGFVVVNWAGNFMYGLIPIVILIIYLSPVEFENKEYVINVA